MTLLVGSAAGLVSAWLLLVAALWVAGRQQADRATFGSVLRLLPDVLGLLRGLAADRTLPRGVRVRLGLAVGYLALPVDLIPDFVPVVGYADDAVVVVLALRSVARAAGSEALDRHWRGTPAGLRALKGLVGVVGRPEPTTPP